MKFSPTRVENAYSVFLRKTGVKSSAQKVPNSNVIEALLSSFFHIRLQPKASVHLQCSGVNV